ncbi:MAG: lysophospholipid acyltransferase family protein [Puniceicoccales bacterium]|jgi:lysophospholipid acyltransferase (LPLAT)-like uncharacterized protein|nr:lysophospholipid acyltransferase family protein [Puniceicoccales bacterium]
MIALSSIYLFENILQGFYSASMRVCVNWLSPTKKLLVKLLAIPLKIWSKTLRIEIDEKSLQLLKTYCHTPKVCALWHNRLFIASYLFQKYFQGTKMYGLISPSRDGAWLSEIYRNIGIHAIRGSTQRGGRNALLEMADVIRGGHTVTITPDGPRGPRYLVKPGIAMLAMETHVPILLAGIHMHHAWRFSSWDRFYLPKPFSRISITFRVILPEQYATRNVEQLQKSIQNVLCKINAKSLPKYISTAPIPTAVC